LIDYDFALFIEAHYSITSVFNVFKKENSSFHGAQMKSKKHPVTKIALLFALMIPLVIIVEIFGRKKGMVGELYSVFGAPFVEEAFKALILAFVALAMVLVGHKQLERLGSKLAWFAGGFAIGLIFGLYENLEGYSFSAERIVPTFNHAVWTGLVGMGIYFYMRLRMPLKLLRLYLAAVGAHAIWNFGAFLLEKESDLGFGVCGVASWTLVMGVTIAAWRKNMR